MNTAKTALVTGTSSGIGREIANLLAERGFEVYGSVRKPSPSEPKTRFTEVLMDVTDAPSVAEAVAFVLERTGRIDVLVNNAGYGLMGALEETSVEEAQQVFDVNVFGVMRVTNAVLPTMRGQGGGRIVNVGSLMGIVPAPFLGAYAATKHALEGYTETLDHEVRAFGVRAILIEPGFTKTKFDTNGTYTALSLDAYAAARKRVSEMFLGQFGQGAEPRDVALVVMQAATASSPKLRYRMPGGATMSRLRRFAPEKLFAWGVRRQLRLDDKD
jgi:NAD(P)-dependent dehydrogenase (short-subunit alcohol dehydrogenase family)